MIRLIGKFFSDLSEELVETDIFSENIDTYADNLNTAILSLANKTIPKTSGKAPKHHPVPWFNENIDKEIKKRRRLLLKFQKTHRGEDFANYHEQCNLVKKLIKEAKTSTWEAHCETLNDKSDSRKTWQKLQAIKGRNPGMPPILKKGKFSAFSNKDKCDLLAKNMANNSSDNNLRQEFKIHKDIFDKDHKELWDDDEAFQNDPLNVPFTLEEMETFLNSRKNKAAGADKVHYLMIKNLSPKAKFFVLNFLNNVFKSGQCPTIWKIAQVVPLPKVNKDLTDPNSYRPISLTSHMGKLLEGMLHARLLFFLEKYHDINPNQSGFRKHRSTSEQILRFQNDILIAKHRGQHVLAVSLDLEKAYDLVWGTSVLYRLKEKGIRGYAYNWTKIFYKIEKFKLR